VDIPRIIAHRGSPRAAPENTLASFRRAAEDGARWVEFDAALTIDNRVIIFHDDALERTSDGIGLVAETPFDAISALDAGGWFGPEFRGEPVPTLEETLETLSSLALGFNMELKVDRGREVDLAACALPIARDCWPKDAPIPLISSFSLQAIAAAKELFSAWPRGLIFDQRPADWAELGKTVELATFNGNHQHFTKPIVSEMRDEGYAVLSYTVNDPERAAELFSWGVDAVFTDAPKDMLKAFPS
jgi:glycerophosphoryl diester phosphodiesterase